MKIMKIYNSFLIRCWLLRSTAQMDRSIFEIEHIQTGERHRAASVAELQRLMLAALLSDNDSPQPTRPTPKPARDREGGN
jgi:hypothetical protein